MFCPQCGTNQSDDLRFCKQCGVNLYAVKQAALSRETPEKFDWGKTWVAEMFLSEGERMRRAEALERQSGISPTVKKLKEMEETRNKEIKAGVITSCVGLGVMIFLGIFMEGIVASGVPREAAEILNRVWIAGVIPFFVGLGLAFNGLVVSKRIVENARREVEFLRAQGSLPASGAPKEYSSPSSAPWSEPSPPRFGVTENTTRQLDNSGQSE
jgi:hypothetical protein